MKKLITLLLFSLILISGCSSSEVPDEVQDVGSDWLEHLYLSFTEGEDHSLIPGMEFEGTVMDHMSYKHEQEEEVSDYFWEIYTSTPSLQASSSELFRNDNPDYVFEFIEDFNHMSELLELEKEYYIED